MKEDRKINDTKLIKQQKTLSNQNNNYDSYAS